MRRLGATYKTIGVFNPAGNNFPARVYPVYKKLGEATKKAKVYLQICDSQGIIRDFLEVDRNNNKIIKIKNDSEKFNSVDQLSIYGFAFSSKEVFLVKGLSEYCDILEKIARGERRRLIVKQPLCGVEICRLIGNENFESIYTSLAAIKLAKVSFKVARGWLKTAPLSEKARARGEKSLEQLERIKNDSEEIRPPIIAIAVSNHICAQGYLVDVLDDGRVAVDIGGVNITGWPIWNSEKFSATEPELVNEKSEKYDVIIRYKKIIDELDLYMLSLPITFR